MSHILKIPDPVYWALVEAARASGTTPVEWIAAHLPAPDAANGTSPEPLNPGKSAEENELADARPWRGTYAPSVRREVLFTQDMEIRTADLPKWRPSVGVDSRRLEADDE